MVKLKFMIFLCMCFSIACGRPEFGNASSDDGLLSGSPKNGGTNNGLPGGNNDSTHFNNGTSLDPDQVSPSLEVEEFDFYSHLSTTESNFVFSPQSVSMIMSALYFLASDSTKDELSPFAPQFQNIEPTKNQFASLWIDESLNIDPQLIDQLLGIDMEVRQLSFGSTDVRTRINNLVREETQGFLSELFPPLSYLNGDFLIASASFFNTPFESGFDENLTYTNSFFGETIKDRQFMVQTGFYPLIDNEDIQAIAIAMEDNKTLLLMMPSTGLEGIQSQISYAFMVRLLDEMKQEEIEIHVPKLDFVSTFGLSKTSIIDFENADFSRLRDNAQPGAIIHQIRFILNEEGVRSDGIPNGDPELRFREMRFNRPFLFSVLDRSTQTIHFLGRIEN